MKPHAMIRMLATVVLLGGGLAHADVVGSDGIDYADGAIVGQSGGTFFDYNNETNVHTGTASDYEGNASVSSGVLVTEGTNAFREYNGPIEGSGAGADERSGAFRGVGVVYYSVELTRTEGQGDGSGNTWGGISSFDFGTERVFFGVRSGQGVNQVFGIQAGASGTNGSIVANNNQTYQLVAAVDFDDDQLRL